MGKSREKNTDFTRLENGTSHVCIYTCAYAYVYMFISIYRFIYITFHLILFQQALGASPANVGHQRGSVYTHA
jgi:hypothetical protein